MCASTRGRQKGPDPGFYLLKVRFSLLGSGSVRRGVSAEVRPERRSAVDACLASGLFISSAGTLSDSPPLLKPARFSTPLRRRIQIFCWKVFALASPPGRPRWIIKNASLFQLMQLLRRRCSTGIFTFQALAVGLSVYFVMLRPI